MGFLPSKTTLVIMAVLLVFCGYLYMSKSVLQADNKTLQVELNEANKRVATQQSTIDLMQKDAETQHRLMEQYKVSIDAIRQSTLEELLEIESTDFGKEANSNASELERIINERTKKLFDGITRLSREGTK